MNLPRLGWLVPSALLASAAAQACGSSDDVTCGEGARLEGDRCVAAAEGTAGTGAGGATGSGGGTTGSGGGIVDPGYPDFPETIGILSIAVRTGYGSTDGTDANEISVCLSATDCFTLNVADVDDFRVGEMDVYHFEGLGLPRAEVDRVEIRSANGVDRWVPECLEIRFDGEPVHCDDALGMPFGSSAGEVVSYVVGGGLQQKCNTCYPSMLTHGPMVGAVDPTAARILVRTDATRRVALHLIDQEEGPAAPIVAYAYPSPSRDFTAVLDAVGLEPSHEYGYYIAVDDEITPSLHTFRTAPAGSAGHLRFAFGSCTKLETQPIFARVRDLAPDLFFFIGDNHYGNTPDRDSLRWNYRWALERPERAALLAGTPTLATWDDHDYVGDNTDGSAPGKDVAVRVFSEYWANPSFGTASAPGVFSRYTYGDVDFFLLDDRYFRGQGGMLGADQTTWLTAELASSMATFKVILSGSQWTAAGSTDSWAFFLPARDALFDFIRDQAIGGVVLLSGDVHRSELRLIDRSAAGAYDLPEITSSPMANTNSVCKGDAEERDCFADGNFFISVDIDTTMSDPTLTATIVDEAGKDRATWTIPRSSLE